MLTFTLLSYFSLTAEFMFAEDNTDNTSKDRILLSPMQGAAMSGDKERMSRLIKEGNDIEAGSELGTPLQLAAEFGNLECVELLLAKGANVNALGGPHGEAALHLAAGNGHSKVVLLLLNHGADLNLVGGRIKGTALHWAASGGHSEVIRLLIKKGIKANVADAIGSTPLHWAVLNERLEAVKTLLAHGADIDVKHRSGRRVIELADDKEILKVLKEAQENTSRPKEEDRDKNDRSTRE